MSIELLTVATVILVALVVLIFKTVIGLAMWRRHKEIEAMRVLPQARLRIRSVLEHASVEHDDIDAISRLPVRLRIVLFGELAASISGAQRDRLGWLARVSGLTKHAEAQCRARAWWQRLEGVRLLAWIGGGAQQISILLGDPNTEVRAAAAIWSAGSEQPETPVRLIKLLNDKRPLVRFAAQGALLHLGRSAVEPLALGLQNPDPQELKAALQVAVGLADTRLLAPAFLHANKPDPTIRVFVVELAGAVGGDRAIAMLEKMLSDTAAEVRAAAAHGLGQLGHWPAGPQLLQALGDSAWIVRQRAGTALRSLGAPGLVLLRSALNDDDPFARDMARQVLDLPDTGRQAAYV
jgi:hypothetical protein